MKIQNTFFGSKMDSDKHYSIIDNKFYIRAENLRISGKGDDGSFKFIKGSKIVSQSHAEFGMVVLGGFEGRDNVIYYFLAHKNGKSKIIGYNVLTETTQLIIQDTTVLRFDLARWNNNVEIVPLNYILNINQVGDLLTFSGQWWKYPRCINLKNIENYALGFTEEDINLIKVPPQKAPEIANIIHDYSGTENKLTQKFVSFTYRYKYSDNSYSTLSFYSDTAFKVKRGDFELNENQENVTMVNHVKELTLGINTGGKNVTDIEVYAREHGSQTCYLIYTANKKQLSIPDNIVLYNVTYKFSSNYEVLDEESTNLLYSSIPHYPKTQDIAGNRIFYSNFYDGENLVDANGFPLTVNFKLQKFQKTYNYSLDEENRKTAVSLLKYKAVAIFYNKYNESTTGILPISHNDSEVEVLFSERDKINRLRIEMLSPPPDGFNRVKFAIKSEDLNYENIYIPHVRKIGKKTYLLLSGDNLNKLKEGDVIFRTDIASSQKYNYTVLKVDEYDANDGVIPKGIYAYIETGSEFVIENNDLAPVSASYDIGVKHLNKDSSFNPGRFVSIDKPYDTHGFWNLGWIKHVDDTQIKEGDIFSIEITLGYFKGTLGQPTNFIGGISIREEIYATANYSNLYDLLMAEWENPYFDVSEDATTIYFRSNGLFPEYLQTIQPGVYNYHEDDNSNFLVLPKTIFSVKRGIKPQRYRTENKGNIENAETLYYETEKTYDIINGQYVSDGVSVGGYPTFDIGFYNGYSWGNGVESYKIKDKFNEKKLSYKFRGTLYDKNGYKQRHKKYDIATGGIYNYELGINDLGIFNPSNASSWKTLPINYGAVQRIINTDGSLSVYLEDKVIVQFYGKSVITDMQGAITIGLNNDILGSHIELPYNVGVGTNPESIVISGSNEFFGDPKRKSWFVKTGQRIEEINPTNSGFFKEGKELFDLHHTFLGAYDDSNNEYIIGLDGNKTVGFNLTNAGFTSYYNYSFDFLNGGYGKLWQSYNAKIYEAEATEFYNNFAGQPNREAKVKFVVNAEMSVDKIFKAIYLQSNTAWNVKIKSNLTHTVIPDNAFQQKESYFYTEIFRDLKSNKTSYGVGIIKSITNNIIEFSRPVSLDVCVNDYLKVSGSTNYSNIESIYKNKVTVSDSSIFNVGDFVVVEKQSSVQYRPDGEPIRGKWMEVEMTKVGSQEFYLTSVYTEIIESKL